MSAKLVAVSGATGQQGGATVDALLRLGGFKVRALTRDPSSSASKELAGKGVEVGSCVLAYQGLSTTLGAVHRALFHTQLSPHGGYRTSALGLPEVDKQGVTYQALVLDQDITVFYYLLHRW